eukprot:TRINITY_DN2474_c0_g1_i1.p1 TRINITY_DN2474_c0_g1~~TRINITY_DN2474_c0_g1_i1.p1  ORF type:complete len:291 (-),score=57.11 TRINITY_DN2474_c0_g1_i1:40-843(-)
MDALSRGMDMVRTGLSLDETGNAKDALRWYMEGAEYFLRSLKLDSLNNAQKQKIGQQVNYILTRAEEISRARPRLSAGRSVYVPFTDPRMDSDLEGFVIVERPRKEGPGVMVDEEHPKFEQVYCIINGIKHSMRCSPPSPHPTACVGLLCDDIFDETATVCFHNTDARVSHTGTAPRQWIRSFEFTSYAPAAFRMLREAAGVSDESFLESVTRYSLHELASNGKSGSAFFASSDSKYIIKSLTLEEFSFFRTVSFQSVVRLVPFCCA